MKPSRPAAHFEAMYAQNPDPWGFETSAYEAEKYDATLAVLPPRRFKCGFEAGCSIGVLTSRLAARCDTLLAVDFVASALAMARARCAAMRGVTFALHHLPEEWPDGLFDLMVFSEILYFFSPADMRLTAERVQASLAPGGLVLLVNYTGPLKDPYSGDEAVQRFMEESSYLFVERQVTGSSYRIDLLANCP